MADKNKGKQKKTKGMQERKREIKIIEKEKKEVEKKLDELLEKTDKEIARTAAFVPLPKGGALEETKIVREETEAEEVMGEESFLTRIVPQRRHDIEEFLEEAPKRVSQEQEEEEKEEQKEKPEDRYRLLSEEEQEGEAEGYPLDAHKVISEMMQKGMFIEKEQIKMMGLRGERTKFHELEEMPAAKAGLLAESPAQIIEKTGILEAKKYEEIKQKEKEKAEGKIFGKGKETSYKSFKE